MTFLDNAARQMAGAWAMAFNLDGWRDRLDRSVDGVLGSFGAFAVAAPLVALYSVTAQRAAQRMPDYSESLYSAAPLALLLAGDLIVFAIDWAVNLALLLALSRTLGAGKEAAGLIAGFNWAQPITVAIQLPAIALVAATASGAAGGVIGLPALALALAISWGIVRRGLNIAIAPTTAVVAMVIVVGVTIRIFGDGAMRALVADQS
ncbi:MAG: hypothetical protein AB7F91_08675 [Parvularculaceae bacterium]|nr:hypothetical protein [Parvularculaceae bacterium]